MDPSIVQPSTQRALAAIVLTDAVSFSARMSVDEEGTLKLIQKDLRLMATLCREHGGQVLKSTGDGLLMSFSSAVKAVRCSQFIQKQLAADAEGASPQAYLQHRIGVHLGDVLFSDGDVLGNGVNIAARLQTQSLPGGICISQTVYDVVKTQLRLRATFLGPLALKNIKEPVPAFQIPPVGQAATMLIRQPPPSEMPPGDAVLSRAAQTLQANPQSHRIKKLVFGLCQGTWENDPVVLSQFDLLSLLKTLWQQYPSCQSLTTALESLVSRLNRKARYLAIADTILQALRPVYSQDSVVPPEEQTMLSDETSIPDYPAIGVTLGNTPHPLRIKKLLYAILHEAWETNPAVLNQKSMDDLVAEVHAISPAEAVLNHHLERILKRLSQPSRYTPIALLITEAFHPLYKASHGDTSLPVAAPLTSPASPTAIAVEEPPPSDENPTSVTCLDAGSPPYNGLSGPASDDLTGSPMAQVAPKAWDRTNLYNLRLEIMRYTNPLRAKILLLSTLNGPFSFSQQDWIALKSKALDELVQDVFEYCSNYADLESKLTIMSHCVENPEESTQTAGVILRAMKPFYPATDASPCPA